MNKDTRDLMFSSKSNEWATPQDFYNKLNNKFNFDLDPCSTHENAKCEKHFTIEENGLEQDWGGHTVFVNPPYGREIKYWVEKAYKESLKPNTKVVMLLPSRTDTQWFHDWVYNKSKITFIKGRLKFGNSKNSAPFGSIIAEYK